MIINKFYYIFICIFHMKNYVHSAKSIGILSYRYLHEAIKKSLYQSLYQYKDKSKVNGLNFYTGANNEDPQCIITKKSKQIFCDVDIENNTLCNGDGTIKKEFYLKNNTFIQDKRLISISPGGYKGFYQMGICSFIKENYSNELRNYIFSGASAGAWNSLFMTFQKEHGTLVEKILDKNIKKQKNLQQTEYKLKELILSSYNDADFDLNRLFIGVTTINDNYKLQTNIFSDFDNLEDAVDCCIASSHIPFITGSFTNKYHNMNTYDGGFSSYPYLNVKKSVLHISPNIWNEDKTNRKNIPIFLKNIDDYTTIFSRNKYDFNELYNKGFTNAQKNKEFLDSIFYEKTM